MKARNCVTIKFTIRVQKNITNRKGCDMQVQNYGSHTIVPGIMNIFGI